jgi:hypothetical protein
MKCLIHNYYPNWYQFKLFFKQPIKRWVCKNCGDIKFTWFNEYYPKYPKWLLVLSKLHKIIFGEEQ